jgi:CelD/BcsL family acetyltransferase involved in cellulose biosynthesis
VLQIRTYINHQELESLSSLWNSLYREEQNTVFQRFDWNLLAAQSFAAREGPFVVSAKASWGAAIIPAVVRYSDSSLRLLGEELFDYRGFLHQGDEEVLRAALGALAPVWRPLEIVAMRESEARRHGYGLELAPFSGAPFISPQHISADEFGHEHRRLSRNLRRLKQLGFEYRMHDGGNAALIRTIYKLKASQDRESLFHDSIRVAFLAQLARLDSSRFEIFTLESGTYLAAALVTLRDGSCRRFYTGYFHPALVKLSPALSLIYQVTQESLEVGLTCDYMTGKQPYKLRLAKDCVPLYRMKASAEQLSVIAARHADARQAA